MADIEELLRLRNDLLHTDWGVILLDFLQDNLTSYAVQNVDAVEIKGMARLIQDVKDIPRTIESKKRGKGVIDTLSRKFSFQSKPSKRISILSGERK